MNTENIQFSNLNLQSLLFTHDSINHLLQTSHNQGISKKKKIFSRTLSVTLRFRRVGSDNLLAVEEKKKI